MEGQSDDGPDPELTASSASSRPSSASWPRAVFDAVVDTLAAILIADLSHSRHGPVDTMPPETQHEAPRETVRPQEVARARPSRHAAPKTLPSYGASASGKLGRRLVRHHRIAPSERPNGERPP
jgi:hypothetical protein